MRKPLVALLIVVVALFVTAVLENISTRAHADQPQPIPSRYNCTAWWYGPSPKNAGESEWRSARADFINADKGAMFELTDGTVVYASQYLIMRDADPR